MITLSPELLALVDPIDLVASLRDRGMAVFVFTPDDFRKYELEHGPVPLTDDEVLEVASMLEECDQVYETAWEAMPMILYHLKFLKEKNA